LHPEKFYSGEGRLGGVAFSSPIFVYKMGEVGGGKRLKHKVVGWVESRFFARNPTAISPSNRFEFFIPKSFIRERGGWEGISFPLPHFWLIKWGRGMGVKDLTTKSSKYTKPALMVCRDAPLGRLYLTFPGLDKGEQERVDWFGSVFSTSLCVLCEVK
jgi:hypothetical protein